MLCRGSARKGSRYPATAPPRHPQPEGLLTRQVAILDRPHLRRAGARRRRLRAAFVLAGRATHMPQAAVMSGIQRTTTVNRRGLPSWPLASDLGDLTAEKLHGMQVVR